MLGEGTPAGPSGSCTGYCPDHRPAGRGVKGSRDRERKTGGVGPPRAWWPGGAAAKRQVRPKQEGEDQDQSLLRAEKERKRTVSAAAVTAFYTQSLPGQRPDHPALQPQRASPGLRSGPAASRALCGPHLPSCLLLCRKVWIWARSCSPSATCPQQAGSPSP